MSEDLDLERCLVYAGEAYSTFLQLRDNGEEQSPRCQALGMYFTALMKRVSFLKDDAALAGLGEKLRVLDSVIKEGQDEGRQLEALHPGEIRYS